ncbi:MAG: hypothetical protein U1E39_14700 [Planctomycetota bacterium]
MSAAARPIAAALVALAAALAAAAPATAGPASAEARARAETAFCDGRLDDLDAALGTGTTPADLEPLVLRDRWWRVRPDAPRPTLAPDDTSLSARRIRWCLDRSGRGDTPYPMPSDGEVDVYPRLTLLVLDRLRRETRGAEGLPEASPLWDAKDEALQYVWRWYGERAYRGPSLASLSPDDRAATEAAQARFEAVVARNRLLAVGGVLGFVLAVGAVGVVLRPRRKIAPAPTDL